VIVCANCGTQNPDGFKFCGNCAAALTQVVGAREQRKVVTVLFCDVTGSTAMGETADPEALRALLARYFDRMKSILESHGGTVEKFIGDAVMAVFGVPTVHEDDALRALRAALEMRDALPALGIQGRIGVNTGEVVTGTAERLATGDAVNVAARLEQAAAPQEILIGSDTYELVESVVDASPVEALPLRGKAEPVAAYRLNGLTGVPARRNEAPMVGRSTELRRLRDAYEQAVRDRSCQLFTVLGNAGVGKSRLVHEFLDGLDATVVTGACLSYGDGITYWPVVDVIKQLERLRPGLKLDDNLTSLVRQQQFTAPAAQVAWSFRKLVEDAAADAPLVIVFDDLQWAEPVFLDLIEHVADLSRDSRILLLCMARPDLLDRRATWAGGKLNATNLLLEPLSGVESAEMVEALAGGLSEDARRRVIEAAEGNPLFVEEMAALVRESGSQDVRVPPTISALLAARLDQLDEREREVLEHGSIEGRLFHRGAVEALHPEAHEVADRLTALVRKDLVRPDKSELPGEDAFRFRHLLIRDAAYDALPKSVRADLHERFALWLEEFGADLSELDEILGYHFEQACLYRARVGLDIRPELVKKAVERLATAGRRALRRGDPNAAANLLSRADALPGPTDIALQRDAVISLFFGSRPDKALALAQLHLDRALEVGDRGLELAARMEQEFVRLFVEPEGSLERLTDLVAEAAPLFESTNDLRGMYVVEQSRASLGNMRSDTEAVNNAFERAAELSRQLGIGNQFIQPRSNWKLVSSEPNSKTLEWFDTEAAAYHSRVDEHRAEAFAMAGRFDEARQWLGEEIRHAEALNGPFGLGGVLGFAGQRVEYWAGDFERAVNHGERGTAMLIETGQRSVASTTAVLVGRSHFALGHVDEALAWATRATELAAPEDVLTRTNVLQVMGLISAARGAASEARQAAEEAIALAEGTHSPVLLGDALFDAAWTLELLGDRVEAVERYRSALALYEAKEHVSMAERTRQRLAALESAT
jgi:class 3 adenylate cyclase/tetratricopeptide (TPR) repeat protein